MFKAIVRIFFVLMTIVLTGCAAHVYKTERDAAYTGKISSPVIVWEARPYMDTTVTARYAVTMSDRAKSSVGISALVQHLSKNSPISLAEKIKANSIVLAANAQDAKTIFTLRPELGYTDCTPLGCAHDVMMSVIVNDNVTKKLIWRGAIKVGAPFGTQLDQALVDKFVEKIIDQLQKEKLI